MSSTEYYRIVSQLNGLAFDVEYSLATPGTKVSTWEKNNSDAQLWIDDPATGTILTKLNGFCLDIKDGVLVINPYKDGSCSQKWRRLCHLIVNGINFNNVLDIKEGKKAQRTPIISYQYNGASNQKWDFELSGVKRVETDIDSSDNEEIGGPIEEKSIRLT